MKKRIVSQLLIVSGILVCSSVVVPRNVCVGEMKKRLLRRREGEKVPSRKIETTYITVAKGVYWRYKPFYKYFLRG